MVVLAAAPDAHALRPWVPLSEGCALSWLRAFSGVTAAVLLFCLPARPFRDPQAQIIREVHASRSNLGMIRKYLGQRTASRSFQTMYSRAVVMYPRRLLPRRRRPPVCQRLKKRMARAAAEQTLTP